MQQPITLGQTLKHAAMSILIGAAISFLTVLFQGVISWLHHIQPETPGALVGMATYIHKAIRTQLV